MSRKRAKPRKVAKPKNDKIIVPRNSGSNKLQMINKFSPKTENQKDYVRCIVENHVTLCHGPAGTGKSMCAIGLACEWLTQRKIDKIVICRSIIACDNDIGALPGDVDGKIDPYIEAYREYFELFLGKGGFESYYKMGAIKFAPVELIRGKTYNDTFVLLEEAQNCTPKQLKLFLSRLGIGSKAIVIGDEKQSDLVGRANGFEFCINKLNDVNGIGIVRMTYQDIMRSPILAPILEIFDKNGI